MKAIIMVDLNDTTLKEWDTDVSKCWAEIKVHTPIKGGAHGIGCVYANNDVELKPMPSKKGKYGELNHYDTDIHYEIGWNDCINEILGESE